MSEISKNAHKLCYASEDPKMFWITMDSILEANE